MDLISKAIQDIKASIPREILRMAYQERVFGQSPITIEEALRVKTIMPRVVVDTNIVGGTTAIITVEDIRPIVTDEYNLIYQIPPERLNYRTILTALAALYYKPGNMPGQRYGSAPIGLPSIGAELNNSASMAMDSRGAIPILQTHEVSMVAHNTVLVRNVHRSHGIKQIRCILENEENLQNISIRNALDFSKLCIFAVKSFIYNELIISLDRGRIERGHEIGAIKNMIESYSDAEENYQTMLREEWGAIAVMNDAMTFEDLIRVQISPSI